MSLIERGMADLRSGGGRSTKARRTRAVQSALGDDSEGSQFVLSQRETAVHEDRHETSEEAHAMNEGKASRTAMMVAYMRAVADAGITHVRDFHDPTARVYLNAKWSARLAKLSVQKQSGRETMALALARASADMMALRTKAIDAAVCDAVRAGTAQLVILGAGLDGRAWRMNELRGVRVFEVDHPATQAFKRAHVDRLPPAVGDVVFVPINFERASLDDVLARAGHDATRATCWIWEGVVMYLTRQTMRATLASVARRSAAASTLIVNYHTSMRSFLFRLFLRFVGEPVRSAAQPAEMAADLGDAGFDVREDEGIADLAARFAGGGVDPRVGTVMRIVVALRRM
jgi:methyltransferase (TIGR00027 family)